MTLLPMLITRTETLPTGKNWLYEPKYDGFRCLVSWSKSETTLRSRSGKDLSFKFPEIMDWLRSNPPPQSVLLDAELVCLTTTLHSEFSIVQQRSRLKNKQKVRHNAEHFPCQLMVFDLLYFGTTNMTDLPLINRKKKLTAFFKSISSYSDNRIILISVYQSVPQLIKDLHFQRGEGIVAKHKNSSWNAGIRSKQWLKWKLKQKAKVILTDYVDTNNYFTGNVFKGQQLLEVVSVSHGFSSEQRTSLVDLFKKNGKRISPNHWQLQPSICAEISSLGLYEGKLREPEFSQFLFEIDPSFCTFKRMRYELSLPAEYIDMTHPDKPILPSVTKADYLYFLQRLAPTMQPFLEDRLLTVIRYPHGNKDKGFYQKNKPDYAPSFIQSINADDTEFILCNDIQTLLWLGNQLALEFHIPFQKHHEKGPSEIVIDLDPPSASEFVSAVQAAQLAKAALDYFQLTSFVKTSGGKGLQVYIPLPVNRYSYEETRSFTLFLCEFLTNQYPELFTLERLKKKRKGKLYLDYLQHDQGKTMIAPYSLRGETGYVATPLEWEELTESLRPSLFTLETVLERLQEQRDPFKGYEQSRANQPFTEVLTAIHKQKAF